MSGASLSGASGRSPALVSTVEANRRLRAHERRPAWVFGYGSLIYKADFQFLERRPACIRGWVRRFWQGSHDHRGRPGDPGRVVTLVASDGALCHGMAYRVTADVLAQLDVREKNGYLCFQTPLHLRGGEQARGWVYIATPDNGAFLGPAPEAEMARQISRCEGPSGSNRDYLLSLARALRRLGADDPHVFALERRVLALSP